MLEVRHRTPAPSRACCDDDYRVCVYDRANIGRSDPATGPLSAADAVADLHILLDVAEVPGPYVLLGASGGGDIAFTYAGTHPDDIVGLVLLDSDVPGIRAWEQEYVPEEFWLPEDGWRDDPEQMDEYATWEQLDAAAASVPPIPAILMTLQDYGFPPEAESAVMALRDLQQAAADLFDPGEVRIVDSPHYMEPEIPEEIADTVRDVIHLSATSGG